ncbi:syntabulin isoform X1 [Syngnathoides biaculeatus]|uniref:syntabulin isoform X1 n=1 Tax=Syngnathoides biaculeatus TaxID=300417 RepID=UPI002ADD4078|nr:syntabulin isoform X1 [Syngnathoides biaculeatus]
MVITGNSTMILFDGKRFLSGSEADFSSSSSTGSLKTRETLTKISAKKAPSHSHITHLSSLPVFKPAGSPSFNYDAELYAPCRTPPRVASSTNSSSCNSSPTSRRANLSRYHSCGDNHGIRPPNPEQYLTPLQRKEVAIRHLKTKLLESDNRVHDREAEIEDLKGQLSRMREDWIEEECHRVEAQLSLKEARKEIKQLRHVVETMKNSLMEKDKGIQKYFIDINIQNRKLESLLQSMELANLQDENTQDFVFQSPERDGKKIDRDEECGMELGDQGVEAMADGGLLMNDEMANRDDILEQVFMSTAVDFSLGSINKPKAGIEPGPGVSILSEISNPCPPSKSASVTSSISLALNKTEDKALQTDIMPMSQDLQALLYHLLKLEGSGGQTLSSSVLGLPNLFNSTVTSAHSPDLISPIASMLSPAPRNSAVIATDVELCCSELEDNPRFMDELDFDISTETHPPSPGLGVVRKQYWSNSFLVDLVAVAAPMLPTVAWLYSQHGVEKSTPVNIAALIRGCCIMGLHSLRHIAHRPDV